MAVAYSDVIDASNVCRWNGAMRKIARATCAAMTDFIQALHIFQAEYTEPACNAESTQTHTCDLSGTQHSFVQALDAHLKLAGS